VLTSCHITTHRVSSMTQFHARRPAELQGSLNSMAMAAQQSGSWV